MATHHEDVGSVEGRHVSRSRLREYADAARSDEQADDDEDDAPQNLASKQGNYAGDHQDRRENQQQRRFHGPRLPTSARLKRALPLTGKSGRAIPTPQRPPVRRVETQAFAATRRTVSSYAAVGCMAEAIRRCGSASAGRFCRSRVRPKTYRT